MATPRFEDLVKQGGKVEAAPSTSGPAPVAPRFEDLARTGRVEAPAAQPEGPSTLEAASRGYAQGGTFGFADELSGALQAGFDRYLTRAQETLGGKVVANPLDELEKLKRSYVANRDAVRREEERIKEAHPTAYGVGDVAGGMATGAALPVSRLSSIAQGAASGLGQSESESLGGDVASTFLGGALGNVGHDVGRGLSKAGAYLGGKVTGLAGQKVAEAEAKAAGMAAEKTQAALASMRGELGAATQDANRAMEVLTSHLGGSLTPQQQAQRAALEQSGVLPALREKLADSVLAKIPSAAANIDAKRLAYETAMANKQAATDSAAQAILSGGEAKSQIMARLQRYAPPLAGTLLGSTAGAGIGMALGGDKADAALGALGGAGARPALWALRRMVAHPAVQKAAYSALGGTAQRMTDAFGKTAPLAAEATARSDWFQNTVANAPQAFGEYAGILSKAAERGPGALAAQDYVLSQQDPAYRQKKEAAQKEMQRGAQ